MIEMLSLVFFGLVVYTFLIVIPTAIENFTAEEFRASYFKYLADKCINSYGK